MAGLCRGPNIGGETETAKPVEPSSQSARRRRMEIHQFRFVASDAALAPPPLPKRRKVEVCDKAVKKKKQESDSAVVGGAPASSSAPPAPAPGEPKYGTTSICGRRRDMEDAVSVHPSFSSNFDYYGVFDGHGCSHVAMKCKDRMQEIVKEELERGGDASWEEMMKKSFSRMDKEVVGWSTAAAGPASPCRCELRTPQCDAVGSTAVVAVVTPEKIIIANCGDSRAVLGRSGKAAPLSVDHKPDRPDELVRIQEAGGRVIYWDGARVLGVLAMSRAIGDNYLKPYVISEPEVQVIDRTAGDESLVIATDGLWDVVSNDTACGVARMCLQSLKPTSPAKSPGTVSSGSDKACCDASILLTKLALARHSSDNVSVVVVDLRKNL